MCYLYTNPLYGALAKCILIIRKSGRLSRGQGKFFCGFSPVARFSLASPRAACYNMAATFFPEAVSLNSSRRRYAWLLLYVPVFLIWFVLLEHFRGPDRPYWVSYLPLDDRIPFLPGFAPIYCLWYPFLLVPGLYLLVKDPEGFRRFLWSFMLGTGACLLICTVFPNGQNLRPTEFPSDGFCVRLVQALYAADTNTNVLPSMHVVGSVAVFYGALHSRSLRRPAPLAAIAVLTVAISLSTVFIKQHSVLDILTAIPLCVAVWLAVNRICRPAAQPGGPG